MKYEIIKKAYKVDFDKIDEGYLACEHIATTNSRNEARKELFYVIRWDDWKLKYSDEDITYLNIPVIRAKEYDRVLFEDEEVIRCEIPRILDKRERTAKLNKILEDPNITHCYIRKGRYYRPGSCGYTDFRTRAGVFTKEEAVNSGMRCDELSIIPIDIDEHNKILQEEINHIQSRIIRKNDKIISNNCRG